MHVLLIEDDLQVAGFIGSGLRDAGFAVDHAADGDSGLHLAMTAPFDIAVVDIMLPKRDGLQVVRELRKHDIHLPVIFLSARSSVDDRVAGLQTGGDDYLVKPFAFSELLARIHAMLRRSSNQAEPTTLTIGDLTVDLIKRKVSRGAVQIELQPREFTLLEFLMRNAGRIVSKTMIMEHVWDYSFDPQTNVVEARMCRLRDKVDRDFSRKLIHTIRGAGYVLKEEE